MRVHVVAFARARELLGAGELNLEIAESSTLTMLRERLQREAPRLGQLGTSLRLARNGTLAADSEPLCDGDEVALLPPVSGG